MTNKISLTIQKVYSFMLSNQQYEFNPGKQCDIDAALSAMSFISDTIVFAKPTKQQPELLGDDWLEQ